MEMSPMVNKRWCFVTFPIGDELRAEEETAARLTKAAKLIQSLISEREAFVR